jgi:effector-binding domain-containing protein
MTPVVAIETVTEQPLAAVLERVRQRDIGSRVRPNLDTVYAFLREREDLRFPGAHNVLLYRHKDDPRTDGTMHVEYAVQVRRAFERTGDVFASATPAGHIATATHVGPYERLGESHDAVQRWCRTNRHTLAGVDWELYGDWNDDPAKLETKVCYLLA